MRNHKTTAFVATALTGLALFIGACGGTGYGDTPPTSTINAAATSPAGQSTSATTAATAAPARSTELALAASSVRFDERSLTAPTGRVTIAFSNRDQGIRHDLHVFSGTDASGRSVGSTQIQAGPSQQTLALGDLAPGTYYYQCDVHASQMMGTLTVS